jgi:hypothetical protein
MRAADISVVIPLNTGDYVGGGTEFHNHGVLKPLPIWSRFNFPKLHKSSSWLGGRVGRSLPSSFLACMTASERFILYEEVVE